MLKQFVLALVLLSAPVCHGAMIIAESGDFLGDSSNPTAAEYLGVLSDPVVQLSGSITGALDKADAWMFTVPAGALLTDINVLASGFDGNLDWVDLFSDPLLNADPVVVSGNHLSESLVASNYHFPVPLGGGTYKLSVVSEQNAPYLLEILSSVTHVIVVPEPSALSLGVLISTVLATWHLVRRRRSA
jgi:hypothetical protein